MTQAQANGKISAVESEVRVWIADPRRDLATLKAGLRDLGLDVMSDDYQFQSLTEVEAVRWADVVLLATSSDFLDPETALLVGIALGAQRPVLFVGPVPVRSPALTTLAHTLIEPIAIEAIAFQVRTLGGKAAERRARREANAAKLRAQRDAKTESGHYGGWHRYQVNAIDSTLEKSESVRQLGESNLESDILRGLANDAGVTSLGGDSWATKHKSVDRTSIVDVLAWVDGAAPFNPVPIEIKARKSRDAVNQVFSVLSATGATIGALIVGETTDDLPLVEERDGRVVVTMSAASVVGPGMPFSRVVRDIRNRLAHGTGPRGEV